MVSLELLIDNSSGRPEAPGVHSVPNRNEYQEYFVEGKGGRYVGMTTFLSSCAECHKIWKPQPPGTLRASPALYRDCFTLLPGQKQESFPFTAFRPILRPTSTSFNPLNAELNPIRHLLALVGARHIVHVSRIRVNGYSGIYFRGQSAIGGKPTTDLHITLELLVGMRGNKPELSQRFCRN